MSTSRKQEKKFKVQINALVKKYRVYDYKRYSIASSKSIVDAFRKQQNTIKINAKYDNDDEIASWNGRQHLFDNIIEDGNYMIYRIYSQKRFNQCLKSYVYFDTYQNDLNAIGKVMNQM